ncbi:LPXTG cell wall anchor domain-containing protein [Actinoplanes sp. NPDC049668]|uniref:LPXTG cell wall anchor domain-containing protein n=1 Tax=unclassified Actinoplanes TaxID=2626549 RepID=UPI0033A0736B
MSLTRRLTAGLPAVGVTVIAALALTGSPAAATGDESAVAKQPAVMATPCPYGQQCDDASEAPVAPGDAAVAPGDAAVAPGDAAVAPGDAAVAPADAEAPVRGNPGYGPATPATVPPGGELPMTSPAATPSVPGGVSPAGTLPLTGAPMALTMSIGGLLVAAGAAAVYYTRRRRSA